MSFFYADFESIVPGGTVPMLADQANELRLAIIERGSAIGLDVSGTIPAEISPGDPIELGWLTGMRAAIEAIVAEGKYGKLIDTGYGHLTWGLWDMSHGGPLCLLSEVHAKYSNCGESWDWVAASGGEPPLASQIRELFYACEVLAYAKTADPTEENGVYPSRAAYAEAATESDAFDAAVVLAGDFPGSGSPGTYGMENWIACNHSGPPYAVRIVDETRMSDLEVYPNGNVGVREFLVAEAYYSEVDWSGTLPHVFVGADFATEITDKFQSTLSPVYPTYFRFDFLGESGGGVPTDGHFHMSTKCFIEAQVGNYIGPYYVDYCLGYLSQIYLTEGEPCYIARYNFERSKFLWTVSMPA